MVARRSRPKSRSPQKGQLASSTPTRLLQILVVDDHPIVREGVIRTIEREKDMVVCGEAASASEAIAILEKETCDLAIVDISIEGRSGIDLIKEMRARRMDCPVLVLTVHDDASYAERAFRAGARGYVLKQAGSRVIVVALRQILAGKVYVDDGIVGKLISGLVNLQQDAPGGSSIAPLSDRELEVMEAIGMGRGTRAIAGDLGIGVSTVETYKSNIKTKLDLKDASQLSAFAAQWLRDQRA
jgi:DNA-binding NarL/FixJ family response regulator